MWVYSISKRTLSNDSYSLPAYSGNGSFKNYVSATNIRNAGPIPIGDWLIGTAYDDPVRGRVVMRLTPSASTDTFGRSGFLIHGDSIHNPGNASDGCIVTNGPTALANRQYINASLDKQLKVIP